MLRTRRPFTNTRAALAVIIAVTFCGQALSQCPSDSGTVTPLQDSFYPYGAVAGDTLFEVNGASSAGVSPGLTSNAPFRFYNKEFSTFYVSTKGLISLGDPVIGDSGTGELPNGEKALIAPYWSDVDLTKNYGALYWREISDEAELTRVSRQSTSSFLTPTRFQATWGLVVTWENVTHSQGDCDSEVNTFQAILATNGIYSFIIFNYARLAWTNGVAPASHALVGLSLDQNTYYTLTHSGMDTVDNLLSESNVAEDGVWVFRVDTSPVRSRVCNEEGIALEIHPRVVSPQGGTSITISGSCLTADLSLMVRVSGLLEVPATFVSRHRALAVLPAVYYVGKANLELSTDGGSTYPASTELMFGFHATESNVVERVSAGSWNSEKNSVHIRWEKEIFSGDTVNVFFSTLHKQSDSVVETLYPLKINATNSGSSSIPLDGLRLAENSAFSQLVTFGAVLVKESAGPTEAGEVRLYSDLHVAHWFTRLFVIELGVRNQQGAGLMTAEWSRIRMMFSGATGTADQIRRTIINAVIDMCPLRKAILAGLVDGRCSSGLSSGQLRVEKAVPCGTRQAAADPQWMAYPIEKAGGCQYAHIDEDCFIQAKPTADGTTQKVCYRASTGFLSQSNPARPLGSHPDGHAVMESGGALRVRKLWRVDHFLQDVQPRIFCCEWRTDCFRYTAPRLPDSCENYYPPPVGLSGGDPHFMTFDQLKYTFNGIGEYVLAKAQDQFECQARTTVAGTDRKASKISAVACKTASSEVVEVSLSPAGEIELLINGQPGQSPLFLSSSFQGGDLVFTSTGSELTSVEITFDSGERVTATQQNELLDVFIIPLRIQHGNLSGLLGNYDMNASNDLTSRSGDTLNSSATQREVHDTMLTWQTLESASLFTYSTGTTHASFKDEDFVPVFMSADIPAQTFCDGDPYCDYDFNVTENRDLAEATKALFDQVQSLSDALISAMSCEELIVEHGSLDATRRRVGDSVRVTCDPDFRLNGSAQRTCLRNLTWSGSTVCEPTVCQGVVCENGGTCLDVGGAARCECMLGFLGEFCEIESNINAIIIGGSIGAGVLLIALIGVTIFLFKTRPQTSDLGDDYSFYSEGFTRYPYSGYHYKKSQLPYFRQTLTNGSQNYDTWRPGLKPFSEWYPYPQKKKTAVPDDSSPGHDDDDRRRPSLQTGRRPNQLEDYHPQKSGPPQPYVHSWGGPSSSRRPSQAGDPPYYAKQQAGGGSGGGSGGQLSRRNSDGADSIDAIYNAKYHQPEPEPDYDMDYNHHF